MQTYIRVEHKNLDKPQSSIKFKISQPYPDFREGLNKLKDKFSTQMHNLFNTRPNYRICLGINADFAFSETEAEARVGTKDPINQINPKYITINKSREIEELHYDGGCVDEKRRKNRGHV